MKPNVLVLKTDGINRDEELSFAFELAGGKSKIVHVNQLRSRQDSLKNYQILAIPGGFSYGDDVVSGKVLALELTSFLAQELKNFVKRKNTLVLGICNGFQVLVRTGLLPFGKIGTMQTTLTNNDSGHFECRWVNLKIESNSQCVFLNSVKMKQFNNGVISYPVAHGEGKFFTTKDVLSEIEKKHLVTFRYVDEKGNPTQEYPKNPNGSLNAIVGICDTTGRILGMMPHPECFVRIEQHPNWRRIKIDRPHGLPLFENMVNFIQNS